MANYDLAAGVSLTQANDILKQYYDNVPASNNPFKGTKTQNVGGVDITLNWDVEVAPTLVFGAPSQTVWDSALDENGNTNSKDKKSLPTLPMVQVTFPSLEASYSSPGSKPEGGTAKNVVVYATVEFASPQIKPTVVAVTIDESGFSKWDKGIFNSVLLPQIFATANSSISVITLPDLSWEGITLNNPVFEVSTDLLVAATTLTSNTNAIDISGITWPDDDNFALASTALLNSAINDFTHPYVGKSFSKSGEWEKLATYSASGDITSISASVTTVSPLVVKADIGLSGECTAGLTALGLALAAVGCALGGGLLL